MTLTQLSAEIDLTLKPLDFEKTGYTIRINYFTLTPYEQDVYTFFLSAIETIPIEEYKRYLVFRKVCGNLAISTQKPEDLVIAIKMAVAITLSQLLLAAKKSLESKPNTEPEEPNLAEIAALKTKQQKIVYLAMRGWSLKEEKRGKHLYHYMTKYLNRKKKRFYLGRVC